jgi:hypothetical protein
MAETSSPFRWLCHEILLVCLPILLSVLEIRPPVQDSTANALLLEVCPFSCSHVCVINFILHGRREKPYEDMALFTQSLVLKWISYDACRVTDTELTNLD